MADSADAAGLLDVGPRDRRGASYLADDLTEVPVAVGDAVCGCRQGQQVRAPTAVLVVLFDEVPERLGGRARLRRHLKYVIVDDLIATLDRVGESFLRGTGNGTELLHECLDQGHQPGGYLMVGVSPVVPGGDQDELTHQLFEVLLRPCGEPDRKSDQVDHHQGRGDAHSVTTDPTRDRPPRSPSSNALSTASPSTAEYPSRGGRSPPSPG